MAKPRKGDGRPPRRVTRRGFIASIGVGAAAAAEAAIAGAEPLEHNGYKVPLFKGLIAEQLEALAPR